MFLRSTTPASRPVSLPIVACLLAAALGLSGCAQYATVSERRPRFRPIRTTVAALIKVQQGLAGAMGRESRHPLEALGEYLNAAAHSAQHLEQDPHDESARETYNFAVARVFTTIRDGHLDPWTQPLRVPAEGGDFLLTTRPVKEKVRNPALYDFTPADQFDVNGTYVNERTEKPGVGAPLVAVGKDKREDARELFAPAKTYYGVTAVLHFEPGRDSSGARRAVVAFEDPLATETTSLDGKTFPMAANFTVPLAVMLARENPKKLEISRVLHPEQYAATAHIVRLQPYDPNKTVVIVTHGLMDSPATWAPMINKLRGDPFIRTRYQFWFYSYPSGYPYPYSAAIMREELDAVEKRYPLRKPVVLIGHSMGSLISRLMITDSGDKLWMGIFGKPPSETHFSPQTQKMLEESLIFRHRPEVGRVIFISGPHRGSEMSTGFLGRFASSLVRAPKTLAGIGREVRGAMKSDSTVLQLNRIPNSVDTLAPNNRFVKLINTVPITPGIPYHSIIGDRGKGGNKDQTKPESSDGVVPYWSSHLDGAKSELVVPSNHSAHQNPQAMAEVRRILYLNAGATAR
jgi:pimeloyl-ACP methyl ester carboxylesterase